MRRLIVIGGAAPSSFLFSRDVYSQVVAADSGYDTARFLSIPVDSVVGDLDSTAFRAEIEALGFKACSHDKDWSDTELALMAGEGEYDLVGGGEGRIDHTLSLFSTFSRMGYPCYWFMRTDTIATLSGHVEIEAEPGTALSFFTPEGTGHISSSGLVWELDSFPLSLTSVSLSNRMKGERLSLDISGMVMMRMRPEDFASIRIVRNA